MDQIFKIYTIVETLVTLVMVYRWSLRPQKHIADDRKLVLLPLFNFTQIMTHSLHLYVLYMVNTIETNVLFNDIDAPFHVIPKVRFSTEGNLSGVTKSDDFICILYRF